MRSGAAVGCDECQMTSVGLVTSKVGLKGKYRLSVGIWLSTMNEKVHATSSAVSGVPSLNVASSRIVSVQSM